MIANEAGVRFAQGLIIFSLMSAIAVIGAVMLTAVPPSNEPTETAPLSIGKEKEMAFTGEVVMIEGNVQIVEDPSGGKKDAYLIVHHLYVAQVVGDEPIELHVNEKTRMDEDVMMGDQVDVLASANGEALSIKKTE